MFSNNPQNNGIRTKVNLNTNKIKMKKFKDKSKIKSKTQRNSSIKKDETFEEKDDDYEKCNISSRSNS